KLNAARNGASNVRHLNSVGISSVTAATNMATTHPPRRTRTKRTAGKMRNTTTTTNAGVGAMGTGLEGRNQLKNLASVASADRPRATALMMTAKSRDSMAPLAKLVDGHSIAKKE